MKPELREKILQYNKQVAEHKKKSNDFDVLIEALMKLPQGQLKRILSEEVIAVLEKNGYL